MSEQDVARALELLADDEVADRFATGDFDDLEPADLSDEERELIAAAAADRPPEVSGFASGVPGLVSGVRKGPAVRAGLRAGERAGERFARWSTAPTSWKRALNYAAGGGPKAPFDLS